MFSVEVAAGHLRKLLQKTQAYYISQELLQLDEYLPFC